MSDPTYNRKQGVQKYWAMFQRERRKRLEDNLKIRACQVPLWDYESSFFPQLEAHVRLKSTPPHVLFLVKCLVSWRRCTSNAILLRTRLT